MTKTQSMFAALLCTFIWGTTFIAQDTGMEKIGPYVFNSVRFFVGFLVLIPFYLLLEKKTTKEVLSKNKKRFFYLATIIGISLFLGALSRSKAGSSLNTPLVVFSSDDIKGFISAYGLIIFVVPFKRGRDMYLQG